jgi:very-short-patch-repair endonuclease
VSDVYPELASFWSRERNSLGPEQVAAQATGTFHFRCAQKHEFSTTLNNFPKQKRNFCPECRLAAHSFAAEVPGMALLWDSERNGGGPETVMAGAAGRFWFMCTAKHPFSTTLSHAKILQGRCPHCDSQTSRLEREVQAFVLNELKEHAKLNTRTVIAPYELDLYLPKRRVGVEVNGDYYYHSEAFFSTKSSRFATAEEYHRQKLALCEAAGIRLAFVWGHAWTSHRHEVQEELTRFVREQGGSFPLLSRQRSVLDLPCGLCSHASTEEDSV